MRLRTVIAASTALTCSMFLLPRAGESTEVTSGVVTAAALAPTNPGASDDLAEMRAVARHTAEVREQAAAAVTTTTTTPASDSRAENPGSDATPAEQAQPTPPPPGSGNVSDAIRQYFPDLYEQAWNVSGCESQHDPSVVSRGGGNWGLFQLNTVHSDDFERVTGHPFRNGALDAYANAQFARWLYDSSGGWGPWACRWAA